MYGVIDTHAHLEELKGFDQEIRRAKEAGVIDIITVGSEYNSNKFAVKVSEEYEGFVYPALGIHPWNLELSKVDSAFEFIKHNLDKAVGVGEIGLDYWLKGARKNSSVKDLQKKVFRRLLHLAKECDKPVQIHSRGAWRDSLELVKEEEIRGAVFHWYSGPLDILSDLLAEGYFISATPAAEYSQPLQQAIRNAPLERILLETDSPVVYKGISSTPADVVKTLDLVAKLKNKDKEEVASTTTRNAAKLFGLR